MRILSCALILLFHLLIVPCTATGQANGFSEAEFWKALKMALSISSKIPRRVRATEETKSGDNVTGTNYYLEEFLLPDRRRFVDTVSSGGKAFKSEVIKIGNKGFTQDEKGMWIEWTGNPFRPRSPKLTPHELERDKFWKFSKIPEELDGELVEIIASEETTERNGIEIRKRYRIWISFDGLIRKTEHVHFEKVTDKWVNRTVAHWDYNPNDLHIESPINKL